MAAFAYILSDIRTATRDLLNEATARFWTDAELNGYINDGLREIAEFSGCIQNTDAKTTTASARTVSFDGYDIAAIEYKPTTGRWTSLVQSDPLQNAQLVGTEPQRWFTGNGTATIEPTPDATYNLNFYVNDVGVELTADANTPAIPLAFRPLLIWYACYRAYQKEQNYGAANLYHQIYRNEMIYLTQDNITNVPTARSEMKYT